MDLSILIPARNEMFLARTIQDALENSEADTEIIATLDGAWANPGVPQHDRVNIIYVHESIGQRAATNLAARLARGRYFMKVDAHCSFDRGFDRKMLEAFANIGDDTVTMVPIMRNLWAFDWKCFHCGWKRYQGPTPKQCGDPKCGKTDRLRRKMVWKGKERPQSWSYCFDATPHFQYFEEYKKRPSTQEMVKRTGGFSETMSLQGSCFMATREKYWELKLCDEELGNWGNQGIEVACKTWLSGGRVMVFHGTWYAHMFRTQGGDFSFPYEQSGRAVAKTKSNTWKQLLEKQAPHQKFPISWLVKRFWPVKGWTLDDLRRLKEMERR